MKCSIHGGQIRGKTHRWNNRTMCGRCFRYFTGHVRVAQAPRAQNSRRPVRSATADTALTRLLRSIFGGG